MVQVFIAGATGNQGQAAIRALLSSSNVQGQERHKIHALVRDPSSSSAQILLGLGRSSDDQNNNDNRLTLFRGSADDPQAVESAMRGCSAAFWISMRSDPRKVGDDGEVRNTETIVEAAKRTKGMRHLIFSTAAGTNHFSSSAAAIKGLGLGLGLGGGEGEGEVVVDFAARNAYWINKRKGEELVKAAVITGMGMGMEGGGGGDLERYTILRPGEFMSNYVAPMAGYKMGEGVLRTGVYETAFPEDYATPLIDTTDIGKVVVAAVEGIGRFASSNGNVEVDVFGEKVAMREVFRILSMGAGLEEGKLRMRTLGEDEIAERAAKDPILQGELVNFGLSQTVEAWKGEGVDDFGLGFTKFEDWVARERESVVATWSRIE